MPLRDRLLDLLALPAVPLAAALTPLAVHRPAPREPVSPLRPRPHAPLSRGDTLKVLSWNVQFCGSRRELFFYDGGPRIHVPPADIAETIEAVAGLLRREAPTLTFLQEVDRKATRTGCRDQLRELLDALPPQSAAAATYWKAPFVPTPPAAPLGRVDMHLATLTPHGIQAAERHQLALLDEPAWRQAFNLKRALLTCDIPLAEGGVLKVANTHLSAFSFGDGTLDRQVSALAAWMESHPPEQPWILAGDFNLLPPGDDPSRLNLSRTLYSPDAENPLRQLIPRFQTAHPLPGPGTYLPHGAAEADRTIDYLFYGGPLEVVASGVLSADNDISDHLPLWAELRLSAPAGGSRSS